MAELKPCPFCGGEATLFKHYPADRPWHILCECGGRVGYFLTEKEAIEAWNKRSEDEELEFTRKFIHEHGLEFALASAWKRRAEDGK